MSQLILVVDDSFAEQLVATVALVLSGYQVDTAASAEAAFQQIHARRPNLIVMKVNLPKQPGTAPIWPPNADPTTASIPIIALMDSGMAGGKAQAITAGYSGQLSRPIKTRPLVAKVCEFLRRPHRSGRQQC